MTDDELRTLAEAAKGHPTTPHTCTSAHCPRQKLAVMAVPTTLALLDRAQAAEQTARDLMAVVKHGIAQVEAAERERDEAVRMLNEFCPTEAEVIDHQPSSGATIHVGGVTWTDGERQAAKAIADDMRDEDERQP